MGDSTIGSYFHMNAVRNTVRTGYDARKPATIVEGSDAQSPLRHIRGYRRRSRAQWGVACPHVRPARDARAGADHARLHFTAHARTTGGHAAGVGRVPPVRVRGWRGGVRPRAVFWFGPGER